MATDSEKLILAISADTAQVKKALEKMQRDTKATTDGMVKSFGNVDRATKYSADNMNKSMASTRQAVQGLSFQMNDIATSLAGGASPFTVMMQQGSQVTQVFQQLKAQGGSMGGALAGAFTGLLNPMSLAVNGAILLAGAAATYFMDTEDDADKANKALQKHKDAIKAAADEWGHALPALKQYADELDRVEKLRMLEEGRKAVIDIGFEALDKQLQDLIGSFESLGVSMDQSAESRELQDALVAITALSGKLVEEQRAGNDTTKTAAQLQEQLAKIQNSSLIPSTGTLRDLIDALSRAYAKNTDEIVKNNKAASEARSIRVDMMDDANRFSRDPDRPSLLLPEEAPAPERAPNREDIGAEQDAAAERAGRKAGKAAASEFEKALEGTVSSFVSKVVKAESGGKANAKNPLSTATGLGQFIESTWLELFRDVFSEEAASMSNAQILALRTNGEISMRLIEEYAQRNAQLLKNAGLAVNEAALYLAHFLGPGGAISVLKAPGGTPVSQIVPGAVGSNPFLKGMTADQLESWAADKMGGSESLREATKQENELLKQQKAELKEIDQQWQAVGNVAKSAVSGLISDLRNGVDASEAFANAVNRLADSLIDMALNSLFSGDMLKQLFGGFGGLGGFPAAPLGNLNPLGGGGLYRSGGRVSAGGGSHDGRSFPAATWANAPSFARGGVVGLRPGEVPIIAHQGEVVIPRGQVGKGGPTTISNSTSLGDINIDMAGSGLVTTTNEDAKMFGLKIQKLVQLEMVKESRPGGLLRQVPK